MEVGINEEKLKRLMWGTWGVDINKFTPTKTGEEPDFGRAIFFAGLLEEHKGIRYLLPAFKEVKRAVKDVKLVIAGDGSLRPLIVDYAKAHRLEKDVILLGVVKNEDMPKYFRAARLTVTPSITTRKFEEQVGMVNIQSMACGTPVVSTFCGGIPEYVLNGKTGILVQEKNSNALAEAIIRILKDESLRRRLGRNARKHAIENFDARKNIQRCEELVLEILSGAGAGI
ncbi:MAG: glycosyltransferase family 4 protein [Candidatus Hadarchaeales archaeon]